MLCEDNCNSKKDYNDKMVLFLRIGVVLFIQWIGLQSVDFSRHWEKH